MRDLKVHPSATLTPRAARYRLGPTEVSLPRHWVLGSLSKRGLSRVPEVEGKGRLGLADRRSPEDAVSPPLSLLPGVGIRAQLCCKEGGAGGAGPGCQLRLPAFVGEGTAPFLSPWAEVTRGKPSADQLGLPCGCCVFQMYCDQHKRLQWNSRIFEEVMLIFFVPLQFLLRRNSL